MKKKWSFFYIPESNSGAKLRENSLRYCITPKNSGLLMELVLMTINMAEKAWPFKQFPTQKQQR